jgi:hypothetical protein
MRAKIAAERGGAAPSDGGDSRPRESDLTVKATHFLDQMSAVSTGMLSSLVTTNKVAARFKLQTKHSRR